MKKTTKIITPLIILLILNITTVQAHGGNITGWKDKNSDKILMHDGKHYGYHKQDGKLHYHEVEWNEEKQRWDITKSAVYYDENLNEVSTENEEETEKVEVTFVQKVDGDTAQFQLNEETIKVRFLGIDTPETVHPTKGEEPLGKEASNFTEEKLKSAKKIELEYDNHASKTDKYDRHLAWVWIDGILLQEELVKNGLAQTYMLQDNYLYSGRLQKAEQEAKNQNLGIWSGEKNVTNEENAYNDEINQKDVTEETNNTLELAFMFTIFVVGIFIKILKKKK